MSTARHRRLRRLGWWLPLAVEIQRHRPWFALRNSHHAGGGFREVAALLRRASREGRAMTMARVVVH